MRSFYMAVLWIKNSKDSSFARSIESAGKIWLKKRLNTVVTVLVIHLIRCRAK